MTFKCVGPDSLQSKQFSGDVLFCCQTPLHFLLTLALSPLWNGKITILWIAECAIDQRLIEQVKHTSNPRLLTLPGGSQHKNKLSRMMTRSLNIVKLRLYDLKRSSNSLVIFNDTTPETQYLINSFHSHGAQVFLGEDGVATYSTGGVVPTSTLSKIFGKILYGAWWSPQSKIGLNRMVSTLFASYPKLIRSDVREGKKVLQLPPLVGADLGLTLDLKIQNHLVFLMPLLSSTSNDILDAFIAALRATNESIAIKFHPREDLSGRKHIKSLLGSIKYHIIPQELPIEPICLTSRGPKGVIGHRTSALHLLKFLRPDLKVAYIEPRKDNKGSEWRTFFKQVEVPEFLER